MHVIFLSRPLAESAVSAVVVFVRMGQHSEYSNIAILQKVADAKRRDAESTTGRRNEIGLAVRQATIERLAEIYYC